ncbi:MAG: hypothetical protein HYS26_01075 [Candidatus Kaiserbacteria bacterium]|nr:MAG: hypothetical protein HYS26_01075 [Candidatus Kaiserbacteria bacterium]
MKVWVRRVVYAIVLWALLFVAAIPLLPLQTADLAAFKAVMAMLGSLAGAALASHYFLGVQSNYLREGIYTAITWMAVNWLLDLVALLPFTGQSIPQYFLQIGIEYLGMFGILVAIGYVLEKKTPRL